jgi:hypothetical protein
MKRTFVWWTWLGAGLCLLAAASVLEAAGPPVLAVTVVKVKGDEAKYLEKADTTKAHIKRLGAQSVRFFRAIYAGEGTGLIIAVSEFENAEAFGKALVKRTEDKKYQEWFKDLRESGAAELVSVSLLEEVTP